MLSKGEGLLGPLTRPDRSCRTHLPSGPRTGTRHRSLITSVLILFLGAFLASAPAALADNHETDIPCGISSNVTPAPVSSKQINLVLDDSGSMFIDTDGNPVPKWSYAKYAIEVFGALLGPEDSMSIYKTSDFVDGPSVVGPLELDGASGPESNVEQIHSMELAGGKTAYGAVKQAADDLTISDADEKWLVILTDGKFEDNENTVGRDQLESDLQKIAETNSTTERPFKIAFMGIGEEKSVVVPSGEYPGITVVRARDDDDLIKKMTGFANLIFERTELPPASASNAGWAPDVPLDEVIVFAQGPNVSVSSASTTDGDTPPLSVVKVQWADNPPVGQDRDVPAVPNKDLEGVVAVYENIPAGDLYFDLGNDSTVEVFYKPRVDFAVKLSDSQGDSVTGKVVEDKYTVEYGFFDENCEPIESELIGDYESTARITDANGVVVAEPKSGDQITLKRGDYTMSVEATYLDGITSSADLKFKVLQSAADVKIEVAPGVYNVSELGEAPPQEQGMQVQYLVEDPETGEFLPPSQEIWDTMDQGNITVTRDNNLEFDVKKGQESGQFTLLPRAPNGDVYKADHGPLTVTVEGQHKYDEQQSTASSTADVEVKNDISWFDRLLHWLATDGWKWLLLLLALIILAGYLFKKRFSKRMKKRPMIVGTPRQIGISSEESYGKFRKNAIRAWMPFVADTATLSYIPPGVFGFRPMRLKAGPRKTMVLVNWKQIAEKDNTEINGTPLGEDTSRAPSFGASAQITANTPQMTYELTPNT